MIIAIILLLIFFLLFDYIFFKLGYNQCKIDLLKQTTKSLEFNELIKKALEKNR